MSDRRMDGQTDRIAISISRVSMLMRDLKVQFLPYSVYRQQCLITATMHIETDMYMFDSM